MFGRNNYGERTWASIVATGLLGATTVGFSYLVHCYGFNGALRFIWEGDPNPEHVRDQMGKLHTAEKSLKNQTKTIATLEEGLQRARLDTIEDSDPSAILALWRRNIPDKLRDLRTRLALLSTDLDKIAATVDQVLPPPPAVEGGEEVRQKKKRLSQRVVQLMARADALIVFFKTTTSAAQ